MTNLHDSIVSRPGWKTERHERYIALARLVLGAAEVPDCKLRTLANFFATKTLPCHRALPDAMATAEVLQALLRRLAIAGVRTLAELRAG